MLKDIPFETLKNFSENLKSFQQTFEQCNENKIELSQKELTKILEEHNNILSALLNIYEVY